MVEACAKARKFGYADTEALDQILESKYGGYFNLGVKQLTKAEGEKDETRKAAALKIAIGFFETAAGIIPEHVEAIQNMGSAYTMLKDYQKSVEINRMGFNKFPKEKSFGQNLMTSLYYLAKADSTNIKHYNDTLIAVGLEIKKRDPNDLQTYLDLGETYDRVQKYTEAMDAYQQALVIASTAHDTIKAQPDSIKGQIAYAAGTDGFRMKNYEKAADYYKKSIGFKPGWEDCLFNLSLTLEKWCVQLEDQNKAKEGIDKAKEAVPYVDQLLTKQPDKVDYLELAAVIYVKAQDKRAKDIFDKCKKLGGCK
jgi:tetratricopeptide (TPR) repeat protein